VYVLPYSKIRSNLPFRYICTGYWTAKTNYTSKLLQLCMFRLVGNCHILHGNSCAEIKTRSAVCVIRSV